MKKEEATHTPGPWEIELPSGDQEKDGILPSINATSFRGEICCGVFKKADAQLIAAAPEMLKALELMFERFRWQGGMFDRNNPNANAIDNAEAAIAKATGKEE